MDLKTAGGTILLLPLITCIQLFLVGVAIIIAFFVIRAVCKGLSGLGQEIKAEANRLASKERSSMVKTDSVIPQ